ncbi:hypothetical protein ACLOJK_036476 [Asimina triloba]
MDQPPSSTQHPDLLASFLHTSNPLGPASLPNFSTDDNSLVDCLKGSRLQEFDIRHYPQAILKMKIVDLKLIGKVGEVATPSACGGTPLYIVPECAVQGEYVPATNIWSLGCVVEEMATGKPNSDANVPLYRIGFGRELPEIPLELSKAGKHFLEKCFMRDPEKRWTVKMLLNHQFVAEEVAVASGGDSQRRWMITIEKTDKLITLADSYRVLEGLRKFGAAARNRAAAIDFIMGKR